MNGTVENITYLGSIVLYSLSIRDNDITLEAELAGPAAKYQLRDEIGLDFQFADLQIYLENTESDSR